MKRWGWPNPEVAYASNWMREELGEPGSVLPPPIDMTRFHPTTKTNTQFVVGRLSRDVAYKHHPNDILFYRLLLAKGFRVRIMGGNSLREYGPIPSDLEIVPEGSELAEDFLKSLDCLFNRTNPLWREPSGRVVQEAMACGLPVICDNYGGYNESNINGVNGFSFEHEDEAISLLERLRDEPQWKISIGVKARKSMERKHSSEFIEEIARFLLQ